MKLINKAILLTIIIVMHACISVLHAQSQRYFPYTYQNKHGIIDATTGNDLVDIQTAGFSKFGQNYLQSFSNDSITFYHIQTGKKTTYKRYSSGYVHFKIADTQYIATENNGKLLLLNSNLKTIPLQDTYNKVELFHNSKQILCAYSSNKFDLYRLQNNKASLRVSIKASSNIKLNLIYREKGQPIYIFYGLDSIYTVDTLGNLLHSYASNTTNSSIIQQIIRPQFSQPNAKEEYGTNSPGIEGKNDFYTAKLSKWSPVIINEKVKLYATYGIPYGIEIPNDHYLEFDKNNQQFIISKTKQLAKFSFDTKNGKVLLPKHIINELEINVRSYKVKETDDTTVYSFHDKEAIPSKGWLTAFEQKLKLTILDSMVGSKDMSVLVYVNQDGTISNFKFNPNVRDESMRKDILDFLNNNSEGWQPAILTGLKVRSYYTIKFK